MSDSTVLAIFALALVVVAVVAARWLSRVRVLWIGATAASLVFSVLSFWS